MKRLLEMAALAVGIALPLWHRQRLLEQRAAAAHRRLAGEVHEVTEAWSDWGDGLVREIKRAMGGRR